MAVFEGNTGELVEKRARTFVDENLLREGRTANDGSFLRKVWWLTFIKMAERDSRGEDRRNMVWNLIEAESKSNGRKHGERERKLKEESFFVRFHLTTWIDDVSTIPNTEYFLCGKCVQKKTNKVQSG